MRGKFFPPFVATMIDDGSHTTHNFSITASKPHLEVTMLQRRILVCEQFHFIAHQRRNIRRHSFKQLVGKLNKFPQFASCFYLINCQLCIYRHRLEYFQFLETLVNFIHTKVDLFLAVCSHQSNAYQRIFGRYCGRNNRAYKYALIQQQFRYSKRFFVIAHKERDNRSGGVANFKAQIAETLKGIVCDVPQMLLAFRLATHNFECSNYRSSSSRGNTCRKDVGANRMLHVVDSVLVGSYETT